MAQDEVSVTISKGRPELTNDQLKSLMADPDLKPEDVALLSPGEKARFSKLKGSDTFTGMLGDVATGVGKGAGQTAFNLGKMVHNTPVIGALTDKLAKGAASLAGISGVDPNAAFSKNPEQLEPQNTAETVGKTGEQIGEFLIPAGATRLATTKALVQLIPDTASPAAVALGNRLAAYAGRILGEGAAATGVAAAHGDDKPERAGLIAGGSAAAGEALGPTVRALLKTRLGSEIAPMLAAIGVMQAAGGITSNLGVGAGLGSYGVLRHVANDFLQNPKVQAQTGRVITKAVTKGGELAAGAESETRAPKRRRLQDALQP